MKPLIEDDELTADVLQATRLEPSGKRLACAAAFALAKRHALPVARIREICKAHGIKIVNCQLGCF